MSRYSIDYPTLQQLANDAGLIPSAAELHGRMLGLMCVDAGNPEDEEEAFEEACEFVWVSAVLLRELLLLEQEGGDACFVTSPGTPPGLSVARKRVSGSPGW